MKKIGKPKKVGLQLELKTDYPACSVSQNAADRGVQKIEWRQLSGTH